jgi:hypothetical protein
MKTVPATPPPSGAPEATSARKTTTLIAMIAWVTIGVEGKVRTVLTFVLSREHSGHRIPTGVGVMQSGQIGRPHDEHETPVSRLGCR